MPDPACWAVPSDLNRLVDIVKRARCLRVDEILNRLGSVLEIAPESLRAMKSGDASKEAQVHILCGAEHPYQRYLCHLC